MKICGNTNKVNRTFGAVVNVILIVTSSDICHYSDLEIGIIIAYNCADEIIIAELASTEFICIKHFFISLVAEFHIIYACFYIGEIERAYKLLSKIEIIN